MKKSAIITGSTSGIGLGIAQKLASDGYNIILNGFGDVVEIEKTRTDIINAYDVDCLYLPTDITKHSEVQKMVDTALKEFGRVDVLVNNAGMQYVAPVDEFPIEKWEAVVQLDLVSCFYTTHYAIPAMKKQNFGRIINIASAHGMVASPFKSAYVAAKHGVVGMTKSVALEVATNGITVNAVCPGYVKTPLVLGQVASTAKARNMSEDDVIKNVILGAQATKKFVEVSEVAGLVSFLCTDSASSITGSAITIDGGWTAS